MTSSALRRASAWAATSRSSRISFSSGLTSESSIFTPLSSPLALSFTATMPPPAEPSTSMRSSSAWSSCILVCSCAACFIIPKKSAIVSSSLVPFPVVAEPDIVGKRNIRVGGDRLRNRVLAAAHADNLGAGETFQHRLDQRIGAHPDLELGLFHVRHRLQRRRAGLARDHDHPRPAGPELELAGQIVDQRLGGARLERDFKRAVLA